MPQNFYPCDREQQMLLPPSITDWVPRDHLVHFVVDCVSQLDLRSFYHYYRPDGKGHVAYEPSMLVALLLYCYAIGMRSSRQIERSCAEHVAVRFITANNFPDHCTISRFRKKFHGRIEDLFVQVLTLCDKAKLVKLGAVAIDGTKIHADAAMSANHKQEHFQQLAKEILAQAEKIDAEDDASYGDDKRGDEPPDWMKDPAHRRAKIKALKQELERANKAADKVDERLQTAQDNNSKALATYKENKAQGKPAHRVTRTELVKEKMKVNGTDPDSRILATRTRGYVQGYNCQAAVDADTQIILAADIVDESNDRQQLAPMIDHVIDKLQKAGINASALGAILSDAGYWSRRAIDAALETLSKLSAPTQVDLLVAVPPVHQKLPAYMPDDAPAPPDADIYVQHEHKQRCSAGQKIFHKRARSIEAVFGQIKSGRQINRFQQRGMTNVKTEWTLTCLTHNLLKLWRHGKTANQPFNPGFNG